MLFRWAGSIVLSCRSSVKWGLKEEVYCLCAGRTALEQCGSYSFLALDSESIHRVYRPLTAHTSPVYGVCVCARVLFIHTMPRRQHRADKTVASVSAELRRRV